MDTSNGATAPNNDGRTMSLRSGGTITLRLDADFFSLTDEELDLVSQIRDMMDSYEDGA